MESRALWQGYWQFPRGLMPRGPSQTAAAMPPSLLTHTSTGDSPTLESSFGSVSFGLLLLSSVSQCAQDFVCTLQDWNLFPPVLWKPYYQILLAFKIRFPGDSQSLCGIPRTFIIVGALLWYHFLQFVGHPLGGMQFGFTMIAPFLPSHCVFLCLDVGDSQHPHTDGCSTVSCNFWSVWLFLIKLNILFTIWSSNHTSWYVSRGVEDVCTHKNLYMDVYTCFIHVYQDLDAVKMSYSKGKR